MPNSPVPPPTPPTEDTPEASTSNTEPAPDPTKTTTETPPTEAKPPSTSVKRKIRTTRTAEDSSKRQKTSANAVYDPPSARLSDLGGIDACIEKMLEVVAMPLCHPEVYLHTGVQPPRGVLLHGPPGCGKTLLANAMAGVSHHK